MFSAWKKLIWVVLIQILGFLDKIKKFVIFKIFTAFPGKFDGDLLQVTNKARKHLMTPHFLDIF